MHFIIFLLTFNSRVQEEQLVLLELLVHKEKG